MAEKMLKMFISSAYRNLKEMQELLIGDIGETLEAAAVEKVIPVNESSHKKSIDHLKESDACVFIIGDYYGTVIKECKKRVAACKGCKGGISFTHCEYRRAVQSGKPRIVYVVENEITGILSGITKFDLENTEKNEIIRFLDENNKDSSKAGLFSGYSLEEIRELFHIATHENRKMVKDFKEEVAGSDPECITPVNISEKSDYSKFHTRVKKDMKEAILRWYQEKRIHFREFAGRRKELKELLRRLQGNSVCVVGTEGAGKTSLIQVGLLLERLSGRKVYALLKDYSHKYTREGYSPAREKFSWTTFSEPLTLADILDLVFSKKMRLDKDEQISLLTDELDRENSILFIDDLQDADEDVKEAVFTCGNNLVKGAVVAGAREQGNCYSAVGPLPGLYGEDLQDMIGILAEPHPDIQVDLASWSEEVFRITQGHPMLVDILVKNASHFSDLEKLKEIEGIKNVTDQKAVSEVLDRLIRALLTAEELRIIGILSVFPSPINRKYLRIVGGEEKINSIIDKWLLRWDEEELVFTFDAVRELLDAEAPEDYHRIAAWHYIEKVENVTEPEKLDIFVEFIYHLLKAEKVEEAAKMYFDIVGFLERARKRDIIVSEMLLKNIEDKDMRAVILGTLGNLLSRVRAFSGARTSYTEALKIYRNLAEEDPFTYEPDVAITLNNLANLHNILKDFKKAEEFYTEALEINRSLAEKDLETYEPDVAMTLNNLGALYMNLKDFKKAEEFYTEALIHKDSLPEIGARTWLGLAILAEEVQREDAPRFYFIAGATSVIVCTVYNLPSINVFHCFQKTQELSPPDSLLYKMATIALISLSKIADPQHPINTTDLNLDGLPAICKALVDLITKGKLTKVEEPKNDIELMFYSLYQELKTNPDRW